jgi:hypothetical protein
MLRLAQNDTGLIGNLLLLVFYDNHNGMLTVILSCLSCICGRVEGDPNRNANSHPELLVPHLRESRRRPAMFDFGISVMIGFTENETIGIQSYFDYIQHDIGHPGHTSTTLSMTTGISLA